MQIRNNNQQAAFYCISSSYFFIDLLYKISLLYKIVYDLKLLCFQCEINKLLENKHFNSNTVLFTVFFQIFLLSFR
jgi:hypothetical protein